MDEQGLWELFFATGSPLVWLAIRQEREKGQEMPAFRDLSVKRTEL